MPVSPKDDAFINAVGRGLSREECEGKERAPSGGCSTGREPSGECSTGHSDSERQSEEEGRAAKVKRVVEGPTKQEREEHEATPCPYRSWCRHCVRGRGRNMPHKDT